MGHALHKFGLAAVVLCGLVVFPKASEEPNPAALFAQDPTYHSLSLSPTGKYIAALSSTDTGDRIVVMPLQPGARPKVISLDPFDITALHWHGDNRLIVRVYDEERGPTILFRHLWRAIAMDPDGSNPVRLMRGGDVERISNRTDRILDLSPDEPTYVHMTVNLLGRFDNVLPKLYRVNIDTGARQELSTGSLDTARWIMDGNGNVVARIDIPNTRGDQIYVPDGAGFRLLTTLNSNADNRGQVMGLTEDGRSLAVAMRRENGRQGLYPLDLVTGALGEALFLHPNFDIGAVLSDDTSFRVIGVTYFDGDIHCQYLSPEMQSIQRRVEQVLAGQLVCIESATKDRSRVIISANATQRPASFHLVDLTTNRVEPIGEGYAHLDRVTLGKAQLFPYQVNTGTQVNGVLILPASREPRGLPLVVFAGGFYGGFDWVAHYLAHRGYAVLTPGMRESKGLGDVAAMDELADWVQSTQDEIASGVHDLVVKGIVDPRRVCIAGRDDGGYVALLNAVLSNDYACAVSVSGYSNLKVMVARARRATWFPQNILNSTLVRNSSQYSDADLERFSPIHFVRQTNAAFLLIDRVDEDDNFFRDALRRENKRVETLELEDFGLLRDRTSMLAEIDRFLAAHIGQQ